MARKRRGKRLTRAERSRKRRAAQGQVTETNSNPAHGTLPVVPQDGALPITETTVEQHGGEQEFQPAPQIRQKLNALGMFRKALDELGQDAISSVVASLVADATTGDDPKARTGAANALARLAKQCADEPQTHHQGGITVNGNVSVNTDSIRADFLGVAREFGVESELLEAIDGDSSQVIDAKSVVPGTAASRRPATQERSERESA